MASTNVKIVSTNVNDFIPKEKFVAAGGGLQIIFGLGAMGGPMLCSVFMNTYGPRWITVAFLSSVLRCLFAVYNCNCN